MSTARKPLNFLIALYPGFQLMDLAGPLDILNIVSLPPFSQPIRLTFIASTLDPVPTKPVPPEGANYAYDFKSVMGVDSINTTCNQYLTPQYTYSDYLKALQSGSISDAEKPDMLFLPGGLGSRMQRLTPSSDGTSTSTLNVQDLVDWIPAIALHLRTGIMTVCTGSDILGRTRLLNDRRATTNMVRFNDVAARHEDVNWIKGARWVKSPVGDGKGASAEEGKDIEIWSSAGISAGMDVALAFMAEYYGGMEVSRDIAKRLEYDWSEPGDGEVGKFYSRYFDV